MLGSASNFSFLCYLLLCTVSSLSLIRRLEGPPLLPVRTTHMCRWTVSRLVHLGWSLMDLSYSQLPRWLDVFAG